MGDMIAISAITTIIYLGFIFWVCYFAYTSIVTSINLKREHNELLREIIEKLDKNNG